MDTEGLLLLLGEGAGLGLELGAPLWLIVVLADTEAVLDTLAESEAVGAVLSDAVESALGDSVLTELRDAETDMLGVTEGPELLLGEEAGLSLELALLL